MKIVVTGSDGFLGTHLRARLQADGSHDVTPIGRSAFAGGADLDALGRGVDVVVHLAGINRGAPESVEAGNAHLAQHLVDVLDALQSAPAIIFSNSVQAGNDSPYGRGKQRAADILAAWADKRSTSFVDIAYRNLFGEGGRPDYNSFVATFCHRLAAGGQPEILVDRAVELIHAQDAVGVIVDQLGQLKKSARVDTDGVATTVSEVAARLQAIAATYASGRFPDLGDPFTLQLFNTYRSFVYPRFYPYPLTVKSDERGGFVEAVQSGGGESQTAFSTTRPGVTRGDHFHLRKVERFVVLKGTARIAIRPVGRTGVNVFDVSGESPCFVDMPTLHTHNITNVGDGDLYTLFWTNEIFDPGDTDTFMDVVE